MSSQPIKTNSKSDHGTIKSYVIGYILSLIFTAIPYYLVVNQIITGNDLLLIIVSIGFLQMIIQVLFFLHLGRGPKPLYNVAFFISTILIILVVVGGSIFIMNNLYSNMSSTEITKSLAQKEAIYQVGGERTGACQGHYKNHKVSIIGGEILPFYTKAKLCDTLTIINENDKSHKLYFGSHDQHETYSGESDLTITSARSKTITLNQVGNYQFHDHLEPEIIGEFTVE